jgi:hypothetical protein
MGTDLPTKVILGQTLVLMQMIFLNNVRKVGRLVLSRNSCYVNSVTECFVAMVLFTKYNINNSLSLNVNS